MKNKDTHVIEFNGYVVVDKKIAPDEIMSLINNLFHNYDEVTQFCTSATVATEDQNRLDFQLNSKEYTKIAELVLFSGFTFPDIKKVVDWYRSVADKLVEVAAKWELSNRGGQ